MVGFLREFYEESFFENYRLLKLIRRNLRRFPLITLGRMTVGFPCFKPGSARIRCVGNRNDWTQLNVLNRRFF